MISILREFQPVEVYNLAATQTSHTIMGRDAVIRQTTLDTFKNSDKEAYNPSRSYLSPNYGAFYHATCGLRVLTSVMVPCMIHQVLFLFF